MNLELIHFRKRVAKTRPKISTHEKTQGKENAVSISEDVITLENETDKDQRPWENIDDGNGQNKAAIMSADMVLHLCI